MTDAPSGDSAREKKLWDLWGKADPDVHLTFTDPASKGAQWHPLICHVLDVAAVAEEMLAHRLPGRLLRWLAHTLGADTTTSLAWLTFFVGLHDLGKATPAFQRKWAPFGETAQRLGLDLPPLAKAPHGTMTVVLADEVGLLPSPFARRMLRAVGAHHGAFPTADEVRQANQKHERGKNEGWVQARRAYVHALGQFSALAQGPAPQTSEHAFFLVLAGLTTAADWVGSIAHIFQYRPNPGSLESYGLLARARAKEALDRVQWTSPPPAVARSFEALFGFQPRAVQTVVGTAVRDARTPTLLIVEAPMGEGKTEAALYAADQLGLSSGHGGLFIGLPTQATSNQMFKRVRNFLDAAYPGAPANLHLTHGDAALSDDYEELRLRAIYDHQNNKSQVMAAEWFVRNKRSLLASFAVGTIDQALLGVLRTRHGFLRMFGLAGKTVVLDEVHAYDTYTSTLMERLVAWLGAMGAHVILLSATLPRSKRDVLARAYAGKEVNVPSIDYPRLTQISADGAHIYPVQTTRPPLRLVVEPLDDDPGAVAAAIRARLGHGGCAVWICNTVKRAQTAYQTLRAVLPPDIEVDLLHARFTLGERQIREARAEAKFGKNSAQRPRAAVLVGTQVLEQSLDLDFDYMVTDLAPLDLVLQRAGRLHRHQRPRPQGLEQPILAVIQPPVADGVPSFRQVAVVYEKVVMLKSWLVLAQTRGGIELPADIERLVAAVYEETSPPADPTLAATLTRWAKIFEEGRRDDELNAKNRLLPRPNQPDDPFIDLNLSYDDDETAHASLRAVTRLGSPTVDVLCLHSAEGGVAPDPSGHSTISTTEKPDRAALKVLLRAGLSISNPGARTAVLSDPATALPAAWGEVPSLRGARVLYLRQGGVVVGTQVRYRLNLSPELGLLIEKVTA